MALRALHQCPTPGCRTLTRESKCEKCAAIPRKRLTPVDRFYATTAWRKLRGRFIEANPLCVHCLEIDRTEPATHVDHVVERRDDPSRELDWENLQSLCLSCHSSKTRREAGRRRRERG